MAKVNLVIGVALSLVLASGCTRAVDQGSKMTISFGSSNSSLSTPGPLDVLIINVAGEGLATPILYQWSGDCDDQGCNTPPPSHTIDKVPGGKKVVQVLAVFRDSATESMAFYHGANANVNATGGSIAVPVTINPVGGSSNTIQGRISGRILTGANTGPSGDILIKMAVNPLYEPMVIERSTMLSGWFSVFGIANVNFIYELRPFGAPNAPLALFGGPVSLNNPMFDRQQASDPRVKVVLPVRKRERDSNWVPDGASQYVWGFWPMNGYSLPTQYVCAMNFGHNTALTKVKNYSLSGFLQLQDKGLGAFSASTVFTDITNPYGFAEYSGISSSACVNPDYLSKYPIYMWQFDGDGHDAAAGFAGGLIATEEGPVTVSNTNPRAFSGQLLPGVETVITGYRVYKRQVPNSYWEREIDCQNLPPEYTLEGTANITTVNGTSTFSFMTGIQDSDFTANTGVAAVLCPMGGPRQGIFLESWKLGGGMMGGPPVRMVVAGAGQNSNSFDSSAHTQLQSTCKRYLIDFINESTGAPYTATTAMPYTVNIPGNPSFDNGVYSESTCSTVYTAPQLAQGASSDFIYVNSTPNNGFGELEMNLSGRFFRHGLTNVPGSSTPTDLVLSLLALPSNAVVLNQCYPIKLSLLASGIPSYLGGPGPSGDLTINYGTNSGSFHNSSDCSGGSQVSFPIQLAAHESTRYLYFRPLNVHSLGQLSLTLASPSLTLTSSGTFVVDNPNTFKFEPFFRDYPRNLMTTYMGGFWWAPSGCTEVEVQRLSTNGAPIHSNSPNYVTLAATSTGKFHTNPTCSDAGVSTANWVFDWQSPHLYFKPHGATSLNVTTSGTGATSVTLSLKMMPDEIYVQSSAPSICNGLTSLGGDANCGAAILVSFRDDLNRPYAFPAAANVNLSVSGAPSFRLEDTPMNCTGASNSLNMMVAAGVTQEVKFLCKNAVNSDSGMISANFLNLESFNTISVSSDATPTLSLFAMKGMTPVPAGLAMHPVSSCEKLAIFPVDSVGHWIHNYGGDPLQARFQPSVGIGLYQDTSCSTGWLAPNDNGYSGGPTFSGTFIEGSVTSSSQASGLLQIKPQGNDNVPAPTQVDFGP